MRRVRAFEIVTAVRGEMLKLDVDAAAYTWGRALADSCLREAEAQVLGGRAG